MGFSISVDKLVTKVQKDPLKGPENFQSYFDAMTIIWRFSSNLELVEGTEERPPKSDSGSDSAGKAWDKRDAECLALLYATVDESCEYLILGQSSGAAAWKKLKDTFNKSSFAARINLETKLFSPHHDHDAPIDVYIQSVLDAQIALKRMGHVIEDYLVKDSIIRNLSEVFNDVRTSILTQTIEPDLETVLAILRRSAPTVATSYKIPGHAEGVVQAYYSHPDGRARGSSGGKGRSSGSGGDSKSSRSANMGFTSEGGRRWCDPSHADHCHRCGLRGHIAATCIFDMPDEVKDWVKERFRKGDRAMYVSGTRRPPDTRSSRSPPHSHHHQPVDPWTAPRSPSPPLSS